MKAILLCTDNIFKLLPITYTVPKEIIPVANTPIVEYTIKRLVDAGINNIAMIVGENRDSFENYFQDGRAFNCKIKYFYQPKHLGSAFGLLCAKEFIDDAFVLIMGNSYFDFSLNEYISNFKNNKYDAMMMLRQVENPWEYESAKIEDGKITCVMEKHRASNSERAVSGIYFFSTSIIKAASKIKLSNRGEYALTNAVQYLIDKEYNVGYMDALPYTISINSPRDLLECNRYILSKDDNRCITGDDSRIINSKIGDFTSIGKRCIIKDSNINNTIIMDDCIINGVEIYDSIVGEYSTIAGKGMINGIFAGKTRIYLSSTAIEQNSSE